ncbi:MAG: tetratricopeptide repeat protein [Spirochaetaceae bacterium]|jgi:tetratricopeptide (TPR) repeat protein|nr:tetratricopeptide repeat protein [Spirochaetaceae bacterium]
MKKYIGVALFTIAAFGQVMAQNAYVSPTRATISTRLFEVVSDGGSYDAETLCRELEERFEVYNRLFRFSKDALSSQLKVIAFTDKALYDEYVKTKLGSTRDGAVYLHYNQVDKRELVVHRGSAEEQRMLPHQAFIQYLRAFIPYPPTWMREGFAIYFNTLKYDKETRELRYEENLSWLETVKSLGNQHPSLEQVFLADVKGAPEYFQPISWAVVSFFLNNGGSGDYFRSLTDAFKVLDANKSAGDNAQAVLQELVGFTTLENITNDYNSYIASRKTFAELVQTGQDSYTQKNWTEAENFFLMALYQKPTHYAPYYYLGLLAYEQKNYDLAERYYRSAVQYGADQALVSYALGINAATAGRTDDAITFLQEAARISPERYRERVDSIIIRLR